MNRAGDRPNLLTEPLPSPNRWLTRRPPLPATLASNLRSGSTPSRPRNKEGPAGNNSSRFFDFAPSGSAGICPPEVVAIIGVVALTGNRLARRRGPSGRPHRRAPQEKFGHTAQLT